MGKATKDKKIWKKQQEQEKTKMVSEESKSYFSNNLLEQLAERPKNTPDFFSLKEHEDIPVFVYGTLKQFGRNNHLLNNCPYLGKAKTTIPRFEMRQAQHAGFPVVMDVGLQAEFKARIYGEVFVCKPKDLLMLDRLEDNGGMYLRKLTSITLLDQHYPTSKGNKNPSIQAWVYLGNPAVWSDRSDVYRCSYKTSTGTTPETSFEWKESALCYGVQ